MADQEKLFNDIKALCVGHGHDAILSVLGQLAGGVLAEASPNKDSALTRLFGRSVRASFTTDSYIAFIMAGIERFFAGKAVVLNANEIERAFRKLP